MSTDKRPTLERFIDAVQIALQYVPDLTNPGGMERFRRAVPVARTIAIGGGNPLAGPGACDALDAFIEAEERRARRATPDPTDRDDASATAAAGGDAIYFVGLCVGLLLADVV